MTNEAELAWAAGVFDGDGTVSGYVPRHRRSKVVQVTVYQATRPLLQRFQRAMDGHGGIYGPYRDRLFHWTTKRNDAVRLLCDRLGPRLGEEKRAQLLRAASGRATLEALLADKRVDHSEDSAIAWAAGFFDAEGSVTTSRTGAPALEVPQAEVDGQPSSCLRRFQRIVKVGRITGPRIVPSPWSRLPQYRWVATSIADVEAVALMLAPLLGDEKRTEVSAAIARYQAR